MLFYKFFITLLFLPLLSFIAEAQQTYLYHVCQNTTTSPVNSTYRANLDNLLSSLSSKATRGNRFYNTTSGRNSDVVYGLYLCRGDASNRSCAECVSTAINEVNQLCPVEKISVIWYANCLVHYSNRSIFSIATVVPQVYLLNTRNVSDQERFNQLLGDTIDAATDLALNSTFGLTNFATREVDVSRLQRLYSLVQCTPDLSRDDCNTCLRGAIAALSVCCSGKQGGRVLTPSCNVRYELYPFYNQTTVSVPAPPTVITPTAPTISQTYLYLFCPVINSSISRDQFEINLNRLLFQKLYSLGSNHSFVKTTEGEDPDKVYGLFLCRGDVQFNLCQSCIDAASSDFRKSCSGIKEAIIWYDKCMVRYSYRDFFSIMEPSPSIPLTNAQNRTEFDKFKNRLNETLDYLITRMSKVHNMYATKEVNVSNNLNLYGLAQCIPNLSVEDCQMCLHSAVSSTASFPSGTEGARVLQPSCNIRYDTSPFYGNPREPGFASEAPPPSVNKRSGREGVLEWIPIIASLSAIFGLFLFCSGGVFLWRRRKFQENHNSQEVQLFVLEERVGDDYSNENFQGERSKEFPSIQLVVLQAATEHFCDENKLGEGGFGPVYKGKLSNGKEIAVKRLSRTSGQGLVEFKNEVMLIARLQHRNLVRLLGCCLEQNEKLLVYEYMPNKSLDVFLFGLIPKQKKQLLFLLQSLSHFVF
ncbi:hypothetical protein DITRI_Ditri17bG0031600 [Diplodiscus trichospermus]